MSDKSDDKPLQANPYYEVKKVENPQEKTGVKKTILSEVFKRITSWPQDFLMHATIRKIF